MTWLENKSRLASKTLALLLVAKILKNPVVYMNSEGGGSWLKWSSLWRANLHSMLNPQAQQLIKFQGATKRSG